MATDSEHQALSFEELVREALLQDWDPLDIRHIPGAPGEYDSYVPDLCRMLIGHTARNQIITYLWRVETERMGLRGDRRATEAFADKLLALFDRVTRQAAR